MTLLRSLVARCRALFRRDAIASEIREELESHLEQRIEQYQREGLSRSDAIDRARHRVGNLAVHQDRGYDVRGGGVMETVVQDVRYGLRLLRKQPGFAAVAIVALALGIGATAALFSVIDAALLRPLPYPHPEQLVRIKVMARDEFLPKPYPADPTIGDMRAWSESARSFSRLAATRLGGPVILDSGAGLERLGYGMQGGMGQVQEMTEQYLDLLGVTPILGRGFDRTDMSDAAPRVVLLGEGYWKRRYGADIGAIGRTIRFVDGTVTIVGVLPRGFHPEAMIWLPERKTKQYQNVVGRLRPGVSLEEARRELNDLVTRVPSESPGAMAGSVQVTSLVAEAIRDGHNRFWQVLGEATALILAIACINVGGLLLARGATRRSELAVRASIGASRWRLVRQLLTESLVLATIGGACGVGLAWLSLDALVAGLPGLVPSGSDPRLSLPVFVATAAFTTLTGLLVGAVPALRLSRVRIGAALAGAGHGQRGALSRRGGQLLIASEIALALVLLAATGVTIRTLGWMVVRDFGVDLKSFVTMEVSPLDESQASLASYYPALLSSLRARPEIQAAGASLFFPMGSGGGRVQAVGDNGDAARMSARWITPGYLEAIGVAVKQGRLPVESDMADVPGGVVIDEVAARRFFPTGSAVGRQLAFNGGKPREVLGVVASIGLEHLFEAPGPQAYALGPTDSRSYMVIVRPRPGVANIAPVLRDAVQSLGPRAIVGRIRTGTELLWTYELVSFAVKHLVLIGLLGGLGLLLTLVGIVGVTSYAVTRRTQEIGIRLALGATPGTVVRVVAMDAAVPIVIGLLAGAGGSVLTTHLLAYAMETGPQGPGPVEIMAAVLCVVAGLAAWIPARRAARVDPINALRAE